MHPFTFSWVLFAFYVGLTSGKPTKYNLVSKKIDKRWDLLINDNNNKISNTLVKKLVKKPYIETEILTSKIDIYAAGTYGQLLASGSGLALSRKRKWKMI